MQRKLFAIRIWLMALAVLMLGTSCAPSNTMIQIEPSASAVQVNDTIKIPVKVQNIANLIAVELHLSFNTVVLEVVSLNDGGFLKADFPVQNSFDNAAGTIDYAVAQISGMPANGSGTLLEIVFRVKASGEALIRFQGTQATPIGVLLSDSNGVAIKASLIDGSVSAH